MSLNDPNWGRGGSRGPQGPGGGKQGPPDLDELWRSFNRKLNDLFGKRGGGSEPPSEGRGGPNPAQIGGGALILAGLVLVVWLASGFYIVVEGQRGIVLTFGKISDESNAGLRWRLPYPVQTHEIVNLTQVRTVEIGYRNNVKTKVLREALMLTDDENIVDAQFSVQYTISNPRDYLFNNRRTDETVLQAAETAFREIVGKSKMDFVLYEGREAIAVEAQKLMQEILNRYQTGITIAKVTMQNSQPPEQVQAAFDDAVRAKQDLERQKNEGQAYYNDVVPKARGAASRLLEEASGYRSRVVANAEGEASRFKQVLSEYSKAPQVTRERMYLDAMQQIMTSTTKILVDAKAGSNLLYLPLDKIMQMTAAQAAPEQSAAPATAPAPAAVPPVDAAQNLRSREALRSRERETRQ